MIVSVDSSLGDDRGASGRRGTPGTGTVISGGVLGLASRVVFIEIGWIACPPLSSVSMWATDQPPSLKLDCRDGAPLGVVVAGDEQRVQHDRGDRATDAIVAGRRGGLNSKCREARKHRLSAAAGLGRQRATLLR